MTHKTIGQTVINIAWKKKKKNFLGFPSPVVQEINLQNKTSFRNATEIKRYHLLKSQNGVK